MKRALVTVAVALPACNDIPEPNHFGAHVVVAADPGLEPCGGSLAHMDEFVARLSDHFGVEAPTDADRFVYYWLEVDGFPERSGCPEIAAGCAPGDRTYAKSLPLNHELVHVVADAIGAPPSFFTEGLAVAFEGLGQVKSDDRPLRDDIHALLRARTGTELNRAGGYSTAGAFTTFLVERHGLDAYLRAYAAMHWTDTERGIDRVFREEFGVSLDDSIAAFADREPDCGDLERDAKLLECAAPELEWDGDRLVHHRALACDQDDAVGPYANDSVVVFRTVTIPEGGDHIITVFGDDPRNKVSLQPCTICDGQGLTVERDASPRTVALAAGRHSLRLHGPADLRTSLGVRIERIEPPGVTP
ncbi:hypothetical protein [Nannocystis pusilla]|uniref:Lipoprotein n=1 Tax=Nannocystis pusilla TaxID=889268 RepID=A0ABS7U5L5_9BACT|nr:hypothetical protein [Nannocystis pusilla]MBZ5715743.1 hypothetical protein [Nannocystis pusilla]